MKIMFFSPFSGVEAHSGPEAAIMEALASRGHNVFAIRCRGLLPDACAVHLMHRSVTHEEKSSNCKACVLSARKLPLVSHEQSVFLEDLVTKDEQADAESLSRNLSPGDGRQFTFLGLPVGELAMYEVALTKKEYSIPGRGPALDLYRSNVRNCIMSLTAVQRAIAQHEPQAIACYNPAYAANRAVELYAESLGIPVFALHAGSNFSRRIETIVISRGIQPLIEVGRHPAVQNYLSQPCSATAVEKVYEHIEAVFRSQEVWTYSRSGSALSCSEIRDRYEIAPSQRVFVAIGSSRDERIAAMWAQIKLGKNSIFEDEIHWLKALKKVADQNADVAIIYRPHPRRFPNKREGELNPDTAALTKFFNSNQLPPNLILARDFEEVSLYDLLKLADAVGNSTSSSAVEAMLLGNIILGNGDAVTAIPECFSKNPSSEAEYINAVPSIVKVGKSSAQVRLAFRWLNFLLNSREIDLAPRIIASGPPSLSGLEGYFASKISGARKLLRLGPPKRPLFSLRGSEGLKYVQLDAFLDAKSVDEIHSAFRTGIEPTIEVKEDLIGTEEIEGKKLRDAFGAYSDMLVNPVGDEVFEINRRLIQKNLALGV